MFAIFTCYDFAQEVPNPNLSITFRWGSVEEARRWQDDRGSGRCMYYKLQSALGEQFSVCSLCGVSEI